MVGILQRAQQLRDIFAFADLELLLFVSLFFSLELDCAVWPNNGLAIVMGCYCIESDEVAGFFVFFLFQAFFVKQIFLKFSKKIRKWKLLLPLASASSHAHSRTY